MIDAGYDDWPTREWERREAADEPYLRFCEDQELDPDSDHALDQYDDWMHDAPELDRDGYDDWSWAPDLDPF